MGGQGSINMPSPLKSGVEGILQALQTVHAVYGISTQKQQQQLLEAKLPAEQARAEADTLSAKAESQYYKDHGIGVDSTQSPIANSMNTPAQQPASVQGSPAGMNPVKPSPSTQSPTNSPILSFIPPKIIAQQEAMQKLHNEQNTGKIGDLNLQALRGKLKSEANAPVVAAAADFNKLAEKEINGLKFEAQGKRLLAQGGPITGRAALAAAEQLGNDFNRISVETGTDLSKPIGMLAKLKESWQEGKEQNLSPEKRAQFASLIDIYGNANRDALNRKAYGVATVHAPGTNFAVPDLQNKLVSIANDSAVQGLSKGNKAVAKKDSGTQSDSPLLKAIPNKGEGKSAQSDEMVPVIDPSGRAGKIPKSKLEAAISRGGFKIRGTDGAKTAGIP